MSKVTQTRDVQAQTFGFANGINSAYVTPLAKSGATISGTTVTTAQNFGTASMYVGCMALVSTSATFGTSDTVQYGVVQSHTTGASSTFTVDAWYTLAGAAGSSANSGVFYILLPVAPPFWFIALSDDVAAVAGTETGAALAVTGGKVEITTNGLGRALADTVTRTVGSTTATMAHTFTYSGSGAQAIGRAAIVNSGTASKNYAYFIDQINSGTPATVSSNGDTFTPTWTITVG